jgi:hypothetical protein
MSMGAGIIYPQVLNTKKTVKEFLLKRTLLLGCILLLSLPAFSQGGSPTFINGFSQTMRACQSGGGVSLDTMMAIADIHVGDTEKWYVIDSAKHGLVTGLPSTYTYIAIAISTGGTIIPTGILYTPTLGYAGNDTFTIEIGNGFDTASTTVYVTVDTAPTLSSTLTPFTICDNTTFNYTPTSATVGVTFTWVRPGIAGISNPPGSGIGNPFEILLNSTSVTIPVTYIYTISVNGCSSVEDVVVGVHPTPRLTSAFTDTVCSGGGVNYIPTSSTAGTTYTWSRDTVAGITPPLATGIGNINEMLVSSLDTAVNVVYEIALTDSGCTSIHDITVRVNPQPHITTITTDPGSSLCSGSLYENFGASIPPPPGVTYSWEAINANIFLTGAGGQFSLVNFPVAGNALVILIITVADEHCVVYDTTAVTVDSSTLVTTRVLYYNYQFIYPDNTIESYQWGYDDAATYDSTMIPGADFQSYVNAAPDFLNKYYWVIVSKSGCSRKVYYNPPTGITNILAGSSVNLKVFPSPANSEINVNINGGSGSITTVSLTDMLGQTIKTQQVTGHSVQFDVADLPTGCYFISCLQNGVKMATTRFIKN